MGKVKYSSFFSNRTRICQGTKIILLIIEAGLVLAQCWSERKRRILLIVPASLRTQWRTELDEKFFIKSRILESANYNKAKKEGELNPFDIKDEVVICSFNFASQKEIDVKAISWDLVIIDEAHRLRNVYKSGNITGTRLRRALSGKRKLLLTATPLQNNLMELFGLVSIIDEHVFGDARTFRDMYVSVNNEEVRNHALKQRLKQFCKRTLRKQVTEYVNYTSRIAILQEYTPAADEETLYNYVSDYLRSDKLYALPQGQRTLITLVLRKLLASSSFAISGTLNSLIDRLNGSNNDEISKRIYAEWKERHKNDGTISGSRQADMKAAFVEEFRDRAGVLIGTEAAAEGINLQFCSLIVNYDLPWNPQRIEQRIGRCHRYGQTLWFKNGWSKQ